MIIPLDTDWDDDWIKMVRKLTAGQLTTKKIKTFNDKENLNLNASKLAGKIVF